MGTAKKLLFLYMMVVSIKNWLIKDQKEKKEKELGPVQTPITFCLVRVLHQVFLGSVYLTITCSSNIRQIHFEILGRSAGKNITNNRRNNAWVVLNLNTGDWLVGKLGRMFTMMVERYPFLGWQLREYSAGYDKEYWTTYGIILI